jgi:hypothetical protein
MFLRSEASPAKVVKIYDFRGGAVFDAAELA